MSGKPVAGILVPMSAVAFVAGTYLSGVSSLEGKPVGPVVDSEAARAQQALPRSVSIFNVGKNFGSPQWSRG
jgi:hypothetical protein